ncbi:MAG: hypothetical protein RSE13_09140 [Planktothrix sp. GU0601_MAG3]|nr:MAG: hypothetical protein RSE13_09140 [Planktothrix sp. GU0601_MAG3]
MADITANFEDLHKWLKQKYKLTEPTLSQVAANLVLSDVIANGISIAVRVESGDPLEIGFISGRADGETAWLLKFIF